MERMREIFGGISITLDILAHNSVHADYYIALRLVRQFSVVSSGIEKVSRWTSIRETLTVTDDRDASRLQDASTILFDYLKSLARMCFALTCSRLRDVHLLFNHTGYFDIVLERFLCSLEIPSLRNIIMRRLSLFLFFFNNLIPDIRIIYRFIIRW